ncbi:hypothetical protein [Georgenia sp. Z1491]|uniref:hypothetical protein n=1 Tax=Georgenia sp. Z1491 TaxID=3416707 RepID=UPI003CEAA4E7
MAHAFAGYPGPDGVAWRSWRVGERVSVRFRDGDRARDALGHLVGAGEAELTVDTRRGHVVVPTSAILSGRRVPPPPDGRGRRPETG